MFDRVLTTNDMIGMTTCSAEKLRGTVINSTTPFSLYGQHVKEIDVHEDEICPFRNFSAIFFLQCFTCRTTMSMLARYVFDMQDNYVYAGKICV